MTVRGNERARQERRLPSPPRPACTSNTGCFPIREPAFASLSTSQHYTNNAEQDSYRVCGVPWSAPFLTASCPLQRMPYFLRRERSVNVAHPQTRKRVQYRIGHRHRGGYSGQLPDASHPQGIGGRGSLERIEDESRDLFGSGDRIVQQAARQQLPFRAVDNAFREGLADALRDPTMQLPCDELGVDNAAAVVHGHILEDAYTPYLCVHLHHHDMRPKGVGVPGQRIGAMELEPRGDSRGQAGLVIGSHDDLGEGQRLLWVVAREDPPILEDEFRWRT